MGFAMFLRVLMVSSTFFGGLLAVQIISTFDGGLVGSNSREPKYKIEFHSTELPYHPDGNQESVLMSNENGGKFLCFLPIVVEHRSEEPTLQLNNSGMVIESDYRRSRLKTPDELMEVMKDQCFIRYEGWWSYEFCHLKKLRQFHMGDDSKIVQEFILGVYDPEATAAINGNQSAISKLKDPRSKDASTRYHAHQYTNGTVCDLTNQPRETEVRFICAESKVMLSSIKEISTCKYAVIVHCPMLCRHPMFQVERSLWQTINCNEMPVNEENPQSKNSFKEDKQVMMLADIDFSAGGDREHYAT